MGPDPQCPGGGRRAAERLGSTRCGVSLFFSQDLPFCMALSDTEHC